MKKNKNSDFKNVPLFWNKCTRASKGNCKSSSCLRYYNRHTGDSCFATNKVFAYIDVFYSKLRCNDNMSCKERSKQLNKLIKRYDSLYYKSKISFSIISSVIISMMITLFFCLLQLKDQNNLDYFSVIKSICSALQNVSSVAESAQYKDLVCIVLILLGMLTFTLFLLVVLAILVIWAIKVTHLADPSMRLIVIPYERQVIIKTISTYNLKLGETIKFDS